MVAAKMMLSSIHHIKKKILDKLLYPKSYQARYFLKVKKLPMTWKKKTIIRSIVIQSLQLIIYHTISQNLITFKLRPFREMSKFMKSDYSKEVIWERENQMKDKTGWQIGPVWFQSAIIIKLEMNSLIVRTLITILERTQFQVLRIWIIRRYQPIRFKVKWLSKARMLLCLNLQMTVVVTIMKDLKQIKEGLLIQKVQLKLISNSFISIILVMSKTLLCCLLMRSNNRLLN